LKHRALSVFVTFILLDSILTPAFSHDQLGQHNSYSSRVESEYEERFCKTIVFNSKVKKSICKKVIFKSNNSKNIEFCANAIINKKNIKKCKFFKLYPSNYPEDERDGIVNLPDPNSDLLPGIEHPDGYLLQLKSTNSRPVRWANCRTISYSIIGREQEINFVKSLIPYVSNTFGYEFIEVDGGRYNPFRNNQYEQRISDIYFYFDYDEIDVETFLLNSAAGVAENTFIPNYGEGGGWNIVSSNIAVNMSKANYNIMKAILLHEIGHTFGLGHVSSTDQLMYEKVNIINTYQKGDLAGIEYLKNDKSKCS
jgi:hypothetical protein